MDDDFGAIIVGCGFLIIVGIILGVVIHFIVKFW